MDNLEEEEKKKKRNILRKKRWYQNWLFEKLGIENIDLDYQETLLYNTPLAEQLETIDFVKHKPRVYSDCYMLNENITANEARERAERADAEKIRKHYIKLGYKNVRVKSRWANQSEATKKAWANKTEKQRAKHLKNIAKGIRKSLKNKKAK
tara:strand:+ start:87 stop:542 length:456 start_codon:yes stop_codon:yes gene_type:complete